MSGLVTQLWHYYVVSQRTRDITQISRSSELLILSGGMGPAGPTLRDQVTSKPRRSPKFLRAFSNLVHGDGGDERKGGAKGGIYAELAKANTCFRHAHLFADFVRIKRKG